MIQHKVLTKNWEVVAEDLFGLMLSSNCVIVVQNLGPRYRYPAAKLVSLTKAEKVIPAMKEIYSHYKNPKIKISSNGPPLIPNKWVHLQMKTILNYIK